MEEPMTRLLLTYGDSNTHGTPPITVPGRYERFGEDTRWPQVALGILGPEWRLAEEGLPGRTTAFPDPVMGRHMDGAEGLKIALQSHGPVNAMTLMLGTNDCKTRFGASAERIAAGVAGLLDIALGVEMQTRHGGFRVLLIAPPKILEQGPIADQFIGAASKSAALPEMLRDLAVARGIGFFDAGSVIGSSPTDGIHFDPEAHRVLGRALARAVAAFMEG
jgi:lysophospholipase L1-like esterase